jgi:hypothetical protein
MIRINGHVYEKVKVGFFLSLVFGNLIEDRDFADVILACEYDQLSKWYNKFLPEPLEPWEPREPQTMNCNFAGKQGEGGEWVAGQ